MKISEIMRHCAAIERLVAEVYQTFALRWPDPPWGAFWQSLANEELGHGRILDEVAAVPLAGREEGSIDIPKLNAIRSDIEGRFPLGKLSLDEALSLALDLEECELDNIYRRLLAVTLEDSRLSHAVKVALGQVGRHEQSLLDKIEERSKNPLLLERAVKLRSRSLKAPMHPSA
jgi:rubrerythrin